MAHEKQKEHIAKLGTELIGLVWEYMRSNEDDMIKAGLTDQELIEVALTSLSMALNAVDRATQDMTRSATIQ